MASLMRMRCFVFLAAFLPIAPIVAEVVDTVSECDEFLLKKKLPEIKDILEENKIKDQNRYKLICQTYKNKPRFLTVYDTTNKIPVFSAYKFEKIRPEKRPKILWMIEPQLSEERNEDNINMKQSTEESYTNQASNKDYMYKDAEKKKAGTKYNRGHLYPNCHAPDEEDKMSTFTLTNVVPQAVKFNGGSWSRMEGKMKCVMENCVDTSNNEGFVVVGAVPSENNKLNNKVNIPSMLWSAFCCYNSNEKKCYAVAYWGENTDQSANTDLTKHTVEQLNEELSKKYPGFNVFPGQGDFLKLTVPETKGTDCQCPHSKKKKTCKKKVNNRQLRLPNKKSKMTVFYFK